MFATCLSFVTAFAYSQSASGSRKRIVRGIFGDRVSTRTFTALIDSDQSLAFEGEMCDAPVVVCEIFNHEELSESLPVAFGTPLPDEFHTRTAAAAAVALTGMFA